MNSAIHPGIAAFLITRGDSDTLSETLQAIAHQTMAPTSLTVIDVATPRATPIPADKIPQGATVLRVGRARNLGEALRRALEEEPSSSPWWWILHDDCAPEENCLEEQWNKAALSKTIGAVGPKQISWDGEHLLEVGIYATTSARRLERIDQDEIDQGQYDGTSDVLAVGSAGLLISAEAYHAVDGFDPVLGPFGDGLDLGRRLHLAGYRVVVAPRAHLRHERRSLVGKATDTVSEGQGSVEENPADASFRRRRFAQLYNWAKAVPLPLLPFLMLWLLLWSPARALGRVMTGRSRLALAEIGAWMTLVASTPYLLTGRLNASRTRSVPRSTLRALRLPPSALRRNPEEGPEEGERPDPLVIRSLRTYRTRSWMLLFLLLLLTGAFSAGMWWGTTNGVIGGAWVSLPTKWRDLWDAAWSGWIPGGDGHPGPADPLTLLLALVSAPFALIGITPGAVASFILIASSPLAALSAWQASRHLTTALPARFLCSLAWALNPALLVSATHGVLAGVIAHIALALLAAAAAQHIRITPLLVVDGAKGPVSHPLPSYAGSTGRAGLAMILLACAAPWTLIAALLFILVRRPPRLRVLLAAVVPAAVLLAPTIISYMTPATWRGLLTTSGGAHTYTHAPAWSAVLGIPAHFPPLEMAGLGILGGITVLAALIGWIRTRSPRSACLIISALAIAALAWGSSFIGVAQMPGGVAQAWVSPALSLSQLLLLAAAFPTTHEESAWNTPRSFTVRAGSVLAVLALVGASVPELMSASQVRNEAPTLPSYTLSQRERVAPLSTSIISALSTQAGRSQRAGRVLVVDGDPAEGSMHVQLWRASGPALTDASPASRARALSEAYRAGDAGAYSSEATASLAQAAYTMVVYPDDTSLRTLADHGIDTILIPSGAVGANALTAGLSRAGGLEYVGETGAGIVWRVRPDGHTPSRAWLAQGENRHALGSSQLRIDGAIAAGSGHIVLAERADAGWSARIDGQALTPTTADNGWAQAFTVSTPGHLVLSYQAWWLWPWRVLSGVVLIMCAASAINLKRET